MLKRLRLHCKENNMIDHLASYPLSPYPRNTVYVINGHPVTKADILDGKRERQRRELYTKRYDCSPVITPCFIWTFHNESFIYHGWWLYVRTHRYGDWNIATDGLYKDFILKIMTLFPCGYLPVKENYYRWKEAFAAAYHRPAWKRPEKQGMAIAWAKVDVQHRRLLDIARSKADLD